MAERLINSKCQDEQQIAAEIAGLPSHIKRLIDVIELVEKRHLNG